MLVRKDIKNLVKKYKPKKLNREQERRIRNYYKERGYKNIKIYWHQFYIANNNQFSEAYIAEDIFHPIISNAVNEMKQWPSLLDKNLSETMFNGFKQPSSVIKNINGFYYVGNKLVSKIEALEACYKYKEPLVIKPTIESGGGRGVIGFSIDNEMTNYKNLHLKDLLSLYKKDFIIQKTISQHSKLNALNSSSLNTLRIMTYLKEKEVHVLSSIVRIGKKGMFTDNSSLGGMVCGIKNDGSLREYGYLTSGNRKQITETNIKLKGYIVPSFNKALDLVKEMHVKVPYFKIISWDIAIDDMGDPVFIEYNTYRQGIGIHQLCNGPLFGEFTDELLEIGRNYKS